MKYTLVQHSGYGYGGDPQFQKAVETRAVTTKAEEKKVRKAGGVLIDTYDGAENEAHEQNYPGSVEGLLPACRGTFALNKFDGLRIYRYPQEGT